MKAESLTCRVAKSLADEQMLTAAAAKEGPRDGAVGFLAGRSEL